MQKPGKKILWLYLLFDLLASALAWLCFFLFRNTIIEGNALNSSFLTDPKFQLGIIVIPLCWMALYYLAGSYSDIYRKSRLSEFGSTFLLSLFGCIIIFFALVLDDMVGNYVNYYRSLLALFTFHFSIVVFCRLSLVNWAKKRIEKGIVAFPSLIIGGSEKSVKLFEEMTNQRAELGYDFKGYLSLNGKEEALSKYLPRLGSENELTALHEKHQFEEVILAVESSEHGKIQGILNELAGKQVVVKILPDMFDILSGSVRMSNVMGAALIEIYPDLMSPFQVKLKRLMDIVLSFVFMLICLPVYLFCAIKVKLSSKGPVFYSQERIGLNGAPFYIFKFRSMYTDAEKNGPALSSGDEDPRITPWGKVIRKWRLDEIPQFYNVMKGDMTLVGPRPERQFFIDKISERAPEYKHLLRAKPGITSWGQVKFGYAENIDEMIARMKYDLIYVENMSIALDLKIMIYTVLILFQGKGQ